MNIEVYSSGTTRIQDQRDELVKAENIRFKTGYPGGRYLDASFYVARNVVEWWAVKGAKRLVLRDEQMVVYEGEIDDLNSALNQSGEGITVTATGYWGATMMRRRWRKRWLDLRITNDIWEPTNKIYTQSGSVGQW